jgi:hypothetical protein
MARLRKRQRSDRVPGTSKNVSESGDSGISIGEIENKLGLDRKTVCRYTTILLEKRKIRRDAGSRALVIGNLFARKILQERLTLLRSKNLISSGCVDFDVIPKFLKANQNKYGEIRS